jgi:hypothetical protein
LLLCDPRLEELFSPRLELLSPRLEEPSLRSLRSLRLEEFSPRLDEELRPDEWLDELLVY